ncbi:MAG: AIPR family protein [Chloroflexi bacterium]|nr:AIPR family protein [Chloroflexota bacterium]
MIALDYPDLLKTIERHLVPGRAESASFLAWYLENYYRLDHIDAIDAVCDESNDKGVDGIYVNENEGVIEIFQSKISQTSQSTVGDKSLREFRGTISQFKDEASVRNLVTSAGAAKVAQLVQRTKITELIGKYELKGVFLSNFNLDGNGQSFLDSTPEITFVGKTFLLTTYISDQRAPLSDRKAQFDIAGYQLGKYIVDGDTRTLIAPIKASDLASLSGIQDQSLFDYNVRGPLGRTQVNKDIVKSIRDRKLHKLFPLFHNGITIVCENITETPEQIELHNYSVVNGCQSLTALFENRKYITSRVRKNSS